MKHPNTLSSICSIWFIIWLQFIYLTMVCTCWGSGGKHKVAETVSDALFCSHTAATTYVLIRHLHTKNSFHTRFKHATSNTI